jgi:hypothetical protein
MLQVALSRHGADAEIPKQIRRGLHLDGRKAAKAAIAEAEAAGAKIGAFFCESVLSCGGQACAFSSSSSPAALTSPPSLQQSAVTGSFIKPCLISAARAIFCTYSSLQLVHAACH